MELADPTGPIGIVSSPGDRLIGCVWNPSDGQVRLSLLSVLRFGSPIHGAPTA